MSPDSPSSPVAADFTRLWRRVTLVMQLWGSAAIFLIAASAWQFHRWSRAMHSIYTRPPGVKLRPQLVHQIGTPLLTGALLDAVLALLAVAGTVYYFRRRKRLAAAPALFPPAA